MNLAEMLAMADQATQGVEVNTGDFKPVDPGTYQVIVVEADGPQDSKRANYSNPSEFGKLIKIKLEILDGKFKGRTIFMRNNILVYPASPSPDDLTKAQKAMAIGAKERKVMLDSIGKTSIENAAELIGASFMADVKIKPYDGKMSNEVSNVKPLGGNTASAPASRPAVAPSVAPASQPTATASTLPWFKR